MTPEELGLLPDIMKHASSPVYQSMALFGGFIVIYGLISLLVKEKMYLSESLLATLVGILFGPICFNILIPNEWLGPHGVDKFMLELARVVIAIQVMAVGVSLPRAYIKRHWKSFSIFLGPIMIVMWVVSSLSVKLATSFSWKISFMIGACITPTDPVLASSIIKGKFANKYIPSHLRHLLSAESGANDGLGFPFLMLPTLLLIHEDNPGQAILQWFIRTWIYEIFLSIIVGVTVGFGARYLLQQSEKRKLIDKESFLVFSIALAIFTTGIVSLIASDDLLAVFIAGNAFTWDDWFTEETREAHLTEVIDMLFNISFFIIFGSVIPWTEFVDIGLSRLFFMAFLVIFFRRLPIVLALRPFIPELRSTREACFAGWFGPMGVGAIFFGMIAKESRPDFPMAAIYFVVLMSIVVHGFTVPITHFHLKSRAKRRLKKQRQRRRHPQTLKSKRIHAERRERGASASAVDPPPTGTTPFPDITDSNVYSTGCDESAYDPEYDFTLSAMDGSKAMNTLPWQTQHASSMARKGDNVSIQLGPVNESIPTQTAFSTPTGSSSAVPMSIRKIFGSGIKSPTTTEPIAIHRRSTPSSLALPMDESMSSGKPHAGAFPRSPLMVSPRSFPSHHHLPPVTTTTRRPATMTTSRSVTLGFHPPGSSKRGSASTKVHPEEKTLPRRKSESALCSGKENDNGLDAIQP